MCIRDRDQTIKAVLILENEDDETFFNRAKVVADRIVDGQKTDVDLVSGATYSSRGIQNAVKQALENAKKATNGETVPDNGTSSGGTTTIPEGKFPYEEGIYYGTGEGYLGAVSYTHLFDGRFETSGGYMPWFGQVKERCGYTAICTTPWNAGYQAEHPAGGPYTSVGAWLEPSLGTMNYRRVFRYTFLNDCDYNDLCKIYRQYVREQGHLRTLKEKAVQNPSIRCV